MSGVPGQSTQEYLLAEFVSSTPPETFCVDSLRGQIGKAAITPALLPGLVGTEARTDRIRLVFDAALSAPEVTALDAVVAAHTAVPMPVGDLYTRTLRSGVITATSGFVGGNALILAQAPHNYIAARSDGWLKHVRVSKTGVQKNVTFKFYVAGVEVSQDTKAVDGSVSGWNLSQDTFINQDTVGVWVEGLDIGDEITVEIDVLYLG